MPRPIRVVLVDDHQMVIDGLKAMLSRHSDVVEVAGEAQTRDEALAAVHAAGPDVVLLDVRLKGDSGLDLCVTIRDLVPDCRVVFLTVYDDEQYLFQALRAGASGFLLKRVDGDELVRHLQQAMEGVTVVDPTLAGRVAASAARLHSGEFWPGAHLGLTQRESEVLALLVAGHSNKAVAGELVISEETVKSHTRSIYQKLDVSDRAQAVAVALREGLFH
ncbi:MAG: response regulator transcription factor [Actinobacteria bacterium]|nr:response regulator transcription factor [Actinomycetota bacterium]